MPKSNHQFPKTLGLSDVFCIAVGAMISAGIFLLPGTAFGHVGPAVMFSYLLGGVAATLGILAVLEMATAMPQAGGIYYFSTRSLGPMAGTMAGILNWAALALKSAFAIWGTAHLISNLFPSVPTPVFGVSLTLIFLLINLLSTAAAAKLEQLLVYVLLLIMVLYIVGAHPFIDLSRFEPMLLPGKKPLDILYEAGFLFVSFGGLLGVVSVAEEVRNPRRNIPLGILMGLAVVTVLYGFTMAATTGALDPNELIGAYEPLATVAQHHYGRPGYVIMTVGALLAYVTTGNAGLMGAARYPVALARDHYAPAIFAKVCGSRKIPVPALLLTGFIVALVQFLDIESIVKVASSVVMLSYVLTNLSVIIIRESGIMNYRPSFRMPFYPVLPVFCIALFTLFIVKLGDTSLGLSFGLIAFSVVLYMCYGLKEKRQSALQQLVGRLARPDYEVPVLERELREVVRMRDNVTEDSFDDAIENAPVIIEDGDATQEDLFSKAARAAAEKLHLDSSFLLDRLLTRERASSTVIAPGVAIPHIILPGQRDQFLIVLAKAEQGIQFAGEETPDGVQTVIFLFAGENRRTTHLRALAMVAQIIISATFDKRWQAARTAQQIREIFLLEKRVRIPGRDEDR